MLSIDRVFVDTGAFIALASRIDRHHQKAVALYKHLIESGALLYTTNHIVDETCTWLLRDKNLGHRSALEFGNFIQSVSTPVVFDKKIPSTANGKKMFLVYSASEVEQEAWKILAKYNDSGFTFTDCTSFATMLALSLRKVFSFDSHFDVMGFERLR